MRSAPTGSAWVLVGPIVAIVLVGSAASVALDALRGDFDQQFNFAEGIFWFAVAAVIFYRSRKDAAMRGLGTGASLTFAVFGLSDLIEVETRAWYSPWWLFALKTVCVLSLGVHLLLFLRARKTDAQSAAKP